MTNLIVGAIFATFGSVTVAWWLWAAWRCVTSRKWPATQGVILVSHVQQNPDTEGGSMYRAEVAYTYRVNNEEFVAGRTCFGDWLQLSWSAPAARIIRRYPKGSGVLVHYNPRDPSEAVLEPGASWYLAGTLIFGLVFGLLGLGVVLAR